jgi:hypothetical protein
MKKLLLLIALISIGAFSQTNPSQFANGVDVKFVALDTLTTAQRDAITVKANKGYIIFNADTNVLNLYDGTSWAAITGGSGGTETDPIYTAWDKDYNDLTNKPTLFTWDYDYTDLINKPTIPTAVSQLTNDSGFITSETDDQTLQEVTNEGATTTANITTQAMTSTGTRVGGNLVTTIGDYDYSGNNTKIIINDLLNEIFLTDGLTHLNTSDVSGYIKIKNTADLVFDNITSGTTTINPSATTGIIDVLIPNTSGTLALQEWVTAQGYSTGGGASISDDAYSGTWNGDTTIGASKNAIFDKIESVIAGVGTGATPISHTFTGGETSYNFGVNITDSAEFQYGTTTDGLLSVLQKM